MKNIEGKNKDQLVEIEYQGERQLDAIEKQGKIIWKQLVNNKRNQNKNQESKKKN